MHFDNSLKELAGLARHMRPAREIATIAVFTSLIIASDYALTPFINVKIVDTLVFASAFVFGLRTGTLIAIFSELIWGIFSPYGFGGYIIPFLVVGELLYVIAGWFASKVWGRDMSILSANNLFFGGLLAICAFVWDTETNFATAIITFWPHFTFLELLGSELVGASFMVPHELSDFVLGSTLAPIAIAYFARVLGEKKISVRVMQRQEQSREVTVN